MNNHVSQIVSDVMRVVRKAQQGPMQRYEYAMREIARRVGV